MGFKPLFLLATLLTLVVKVSKADKIEMKINLGGDAVDGFSAEQEVVEIGEDMPKMRFHGAINGHGDDLNVFKTQRFSRGEDLVLNIPVPDGVYSVTLLFAETWNGAYAAGRRVFDVYMGSKPNGIVKVCAQLDPFRSGGPAGPVRRKFKGIATQGGLTVALRPIKQNPQIAGIVISGYSYANALLDDLPTAPAPPSRPDFSILDNVRPVPPADADLIYDPSLNPKLKPSSGGETNSPSYSGGSRSAPFGNSAAGTFPTLGQSAGLRNTLPASSSQKYGYPGSSNGFSGASGGFSSISGVNTQSGPPRGQYPSSLLVRPAVGYRRRLASYPNDYGQSDSDVMARLETLNSKIAQEQLAMNSGMSSASPNTGMYTPNADPHTFGSPAQSYNSQLPTSSGFQAAPLSPERSGFSGLDSQTAGQLPQAGGSTQQPDVSYSDAPDPSLPLGDAAQRLYQAQSEAMEATSQHQREPSTSTAAGWPVEQGSSVNQGSQQHSPGMRTGSEDPDSTLGSSAATSSDGFQPAPNGANPYHFGDTRQRGSQSEVSGYNAGNEPRGVPPSFGSSLHDRPAIDSYRMSSEGQHMRGSQGTYGGTAMQSDNGALSRDLLRTAHVERMAHSPEGIGEIAQYGRTVRTGEDHNYPSRYNTPYSNTNSQANSNGGQYPHSTRQSMPNVPELPNIPGFPGMSGIPGAASGGPEDGQPLDQPATPGIHNGPLGLEGICIDNSTHCSCGMAEQRQMPPEECLFVVNEDVSPMICARRPCSGRLICACASGANTLCKRSFVKHILVPATVHKHGVTEEPNVVLCKRERIEQGVGVLTPII